MTLGSPFSPESIRESVHKSLDAGLAAIPDGKNGALVIDATNERVRLLIAVRAGDSWEIVGGAAYDGDHVSGSVSVVGSWK